MKNLSFFVSAFALCASTSYAAINCGTLPSCSDLGYTDKVAECPSSSEVLKCPFDTTYGKCTRGPSIGDLKYSLRGDDHDGWLKCDGRQFSSDSTAKYYKLFKVIGTNFCHKFTSKTDTSYTTSNCSSGMFAVPDYRGFFLRGMPTSRLTNATGITATSSYYSYAAGFMTGSMGSYNLYTPRTEELPNIKGEAAGFLEGYTPTHQEQGTDQTKLVSGVFSTSATNTYVGSNGGWDKDNYKLMFSAANTPGTGKGVYKDDGHVIPAHYAANIFIYAGR